MKRSLLAILTLFTVLPLFSCDSSNGGTITFDASQISKTPKEEVQTFKYKNHSFIYYNVYNDGDGNFVMADNSSYIYNDDIQFGLKVGTPYVYQKEDGEEKLLDYKDCNGGQYIFSIIDHGFTIRGCALEISLSIENVNIGKITHWC